MRKERVAQAKATEAIKAKWAAERQAFLEGGGTPQADAYGAPSPSASYDEQPYQQQQPQPQQNNNNASRPLSVRERREQEHLEMLRQARIQAFQDRQRVAAAHGRGGAGHHYSPTTTPTEQADQHQHRQQPVSESEIQFVPRGTSMHTCVAAAPHRAMCNRWRRRWWWWSGFRSSRKTKSPGPPELDRTRGHTCHSRNDLVVTLIVCVLVLVWLCVCVFARLPCACAFAGARDCLDARTTSAHVRYLAKGRVTSRCSSLPCSGRCLRRRRRNLTSWSS